LECDHEYRQLGGESFFIAAVIDGIPLVFKHSTGASKTYIDRNSVIKLGLGPLVVPSRFSPDGEDTGFLLGQHISYAECIHADIRFQGASRETWICVIDNKIHSEMLMLGNDVTEPWTRSGRRDKWEDNPIQSDPIQSNGKFYTPDMNGKEVFVTHTYSDRDIAKRIAINLKRQMCEYGQ